MKKRVLSALLAACLVLTMAPVAFAAEGDTTATAETRAGSYEVTADVAVFRGETLVGQSDSLSDAISAYATEGDTVLLYNNITLTEDVTVDKAVTIDGQGYTVSKDAAVTTGITVTAFYSTTPPAIQNVTLDGFGLTTGAGLDQLTLTDVIISNGTNAAVTVNTGKVFITSGEYTGTLTVNDGSLEISGGTFSNDPSQFLAEGYEAYQAANRYWEVQAIAPESEPVVGAPEVSVSEDIPEADRADVQDAVSTLNVEGLDSALMEAASDADTVLTDARRTELLEEAKTTLTPGADETVTIYVQAYLDVVAKAYTAGSALELDITPTVRYVGSTAETADGIDLSEGGNAVVVGDSSKAAIPTGTSVTISLTLPDGFAESGATLYVNHDSAYTYAYQTTVAADSSIEFTNPHGFSTFVVTTELPEAQIAGDTYYYADLGEAMTAANVNDTIVVMKSVATPITVTKALVFQAADGVTFSTDSFVYDNTALKLVERDGIFTFAPVGNYVVTLHAGRGGSLFTGGTEANDGTASMDYAANEYVQVDVAPDTGYELQSLAYSVGADTDVRYDVTLVEGETYFVLTYHISNDMDVYATFVETDNGGSSGGGGGGAASYRITVEETEHGTVTVNRTSAARGTRVTITVDPDNGYALGTLSVTDRNGNEVELTRVNSTTYTFQMPNSRVTVSATFVADNTLPFTDVSVSDWFYEAVRYVYDRGLMNGITSTTFGPNRTTERGMIVTILYRLEGEPTVGASTFSDVASNFYYTDAIAWAAENDIVNGYPDGTFRPGQAITRQEMATILYRYASYRGYDVSASASLSGYTDAAQVGAYAADAMAWANATGLVTGTTVTTLTPTGGATRAQVATILMRFLNTLA